MKIFFAVLLCATSIYCSGKREDSTQVDSEKQLSDNLPKKKLVIKNESKYSQSFISSLKHFLESDANITGAELVDSVIVLSHDQQKLPIKFPSYPKMNRHYTFTANAGSAYYELSLHRVNYSDVEYHIVLKDGLEIVHDSKGVAFISPGFINAAEIYEDEITGTGYPMYGYDSEGNNCPISLYVSAPYAGEKELKAKIKEIACGDAKLSEMIEKMPTLLTKIK
jgi:hypothetical protein